MDGDLPPHIGRPGCESGRASSAFSEILCPLQPVARSPLPDGRVDLGPSAWDQSISDNVSISIVAGWWKLHARKGRGQGTGNRTIPHKLPGGEWGVSF